MESPRNADLEQDETLDGREKARLSWNGIQARTNNVAEVIAVVAFPAVAAKENNFIMLLFCGIYLFYECMYDLIDLL
jgi:hypothetical protein